MERRQSTRVHAHGSVRVRDGGHELHGRLMMLSPQDLEVRCDLGVDPFELVGRSVDVSVWWEQAGSWYTLQGQVSYARPDEHSLVISVQEQPRDLLAAIERELADRSSEGRAAAVMVFDTDHERRTRLAQAFREQGCAVVEAASRLEAFEAFEASDRGAAAQLDAILVAETVPQNVGEDLRAYLELAHPASLVLPLAGDIDPRRVVASVRELVASRVDQASAGR